MTDSTIIEELEDGKLLISHTGSEYQLTHYKVFEDLVALCNENADKIDLLKQSCKKDVEILHKEILQLKTALAFAVGELSTHSSYIVWSPEQLLQQFLDEARRG